VQESNTSNCNDTFAWLIFKEVERYVNEHIDEYELWAQEHTAKPNRDAETQNYKEKKNDNRQPDVQPRP